MNFIETRQPSISLAATLLCCCYCVALTMASSLTYVVNTSLPVSVPLPPDFASFSVEVYCAKNLLVHLDGSPRASYLNMIGFLRNASRLPRGPNVRVGGDSSDHTIYRDNCTGVPLPPGITYCSSPSDLAAMSLLATINGTITIGLNLAHSVVAEAVEYANAVSQSTTLKPLVESYEIGNEPDLYASNGLRPSNYTYSGYSNDFYKWFEALRTQTNLTFPAIQGAVFCCDFYDLWLAEYIEAYESKGFFTSISYHHYPLLACDHNVVTLSELLSPYAASSVNFYAPFATISQKKNESKGFFTSISYHHYPLLACDHNVVTLSELLSPYAASSVNFYAPFATI
ncbi:membrane-associated protein, putative, partial [Bodo saltans]